MIHQTIFDNFAKENAMELDRYRALVCAIRSEEHTSELQSH